MQRAITKGDVSSASNPVLDIWLQALVTDDTGVATSLLVDPTALSFRVFSVSTNGDYAQVFPLSGAHAVDLSADKIDGQAGHFAAAWDTVDAEKGRHEVRWVATMPGGRTERVVRAFDVLEGGVPSFGAQGYLSPSDMREEGLDEGQCSNARLIRLIAMQSAYIDRVTRRFFEPRFQTQHLSGSGARGCLFGDPIIALVDVSLGNPAQQPVGPESFRVFNRHLTQRLANPDDRNSPKIEFWHFRDLFGPQRTASMSSPLFGVPFRDMYFPAGVQNVNVRGLFGYTDWDGSSTGDTPLQIQQATKLLVMRDVGKMADCDAREDRKRSRILQERTRDQSYQLQETTEGAFTGDREIDDILLSFMRPLDLGSV